MKVLKSFNIFITIIIISSAVFFIFFFSVSAEYLNRDILARYPSAEILIEKDMGGSKIIFFSVVKNKTGIANYVRLPFSEKYYCQKIYVLENLKGQPQEIKDVFMGTWNGYVITATPENIHLENTKKAYGTYWILVYSFVILAWIEWFVYMSLKRKNKSWIQKGSNDKQ